MLLNTNNVSYLRSPSRHYTGAVRSSSQSSRQFREGDRRTESRNESPVGPQTVWLSKKMKELTENQTGKTATTNTDPVSSRARIYERNISTSTYASSLNDQERTERTTRTFLDDLGSSMKNGASISPTDSFICQSIEIKW